jgi:predicted N-formylglutamate amidohydrolase
VQGRTTLNPDPRNPEIPGLAGIAALGEDDPAPFSVMAGGGRVDLLLLGDHAGNAIPSRLGHLGLGAADRTRHIAWDIGVREFGARMATLLGATFVHQHFSRLVIDCNRDPQSAQAILSVSDGTPVPGNLGIGDAERESRRLTIHAPYHERIAAEVALRQRVARAGPLVVALHSFTPVLGAERRPWDVGVLHGVGDTRPSRAMLSCLRREGDVTVGDNQPYRLDEADYTVLRHACANALPYLELEFRQDLLVDAEHVEKWAIRCAGWIGEVMGRL